MFRKRFRICFVLLLALVFVIFSYIVSFGEESGYEGLQTENVRGKVVEVLDAQDSQIDYSGGSLENSTQTVRVRIADGSHKDNVVQADYALSLGFTGKENNALLKVGDEVLMTLELNTDGTVKQMY